MKVPKWKSLYFIILNLKKYFQILPNRFDRLHNPHHCDSPHLRAPHRCAIDRHQHQHQQHCCSNTNVNNIFSPLIVSIHVNIITVIIVCVAFPLSFVIYHFHHRSPPCIFATSTSTSQSTSLSPTATTSTTSTLSTTSAISLPVQISILWCQFQLRCLSWLKI